MGDLQGLPAQGGNQLLMDELDHLLDRVQSLVNLSAHTPLADSLLKATDHMEVDVSLQQGQADLPQHLVDIALPQSAQTRQRLKMPSNRLLSESNIGCLP